MERGRSRGRRTQLGKCPRDVEGTNCLLGGFVRSFVLPDSLVSRDVDQLDCGNLTSVGVCKTETLLGI